LYAFPIYPLLATCPVHLVPIHLVILMKLSKQYKLWISSLCSLVAPATSSLKGWNTLPSTLLSAPQCMFFLKCILFVCI
jgi:hypothetical protein